MDELMAKFHDLIGEALESENLLQEEFRKCETSLDEFVIQATQNGTPIRSKKRPKRLDSTSDRSGLTDDSRAGDASLLAVPKNTGNQALNSSGTHDTAGPENTSVRPSRAARLKAQEKLKEPNLTEKMRAPSITIKKERLTDVVENPKKSAKEPQVQQSVESMDVDSENNVNLANRPAAESQPRHSKEDEGFSSSSNDKGKEKEAAGNMSKRPTTTGQIEQVVVKYEVLSDEEMPPPKVPLPKQKGRKKKQNAEMPKPLKQEKRSDEFSSSAVSSAHESSLSSTGSTKTKQMTTAVTRSQKRSEDVAALMEHVVTIKSEKLSKDKKEKNRTIASATSNKPSSPAQSENSVYEDAQDDHNVRPLAVMIEKMTVSYTGTPIVCQEAPNGTFSVATSGGSANGTFAIPTVQDGTFAVTSPLEVGNETFNIRQLPGPGDGTFVVGNGPTPEQARALVNASIMTDDNSIIESSPTYHPTKPTIPANKPAVQKKPVAAKKPTTKASKKNMELFNPCIQSPIKSRIEAFEKVTVGSPMMIRTAKLTTPSQPTMRLLKASNNTPLSARLPTKTSTATPTYGSVPVTKAASASKAAQMQRKAMGAAAPVTSSKSHSLSREPSCERPLSAASSTTSLLDEKKKKREEKQRLAQQQREAMEREKREHAERLVKEKEEKHRKLLQEKEEKARLEAAKKARKLEEFEKRRHLEELNQKQLAEQKREELAKLEQQHRLDREQAEMLKQNLAKENYEIKMHKQIYQQKLHKQQQAMQQKHMKTLQADAADGKSTFTFDMILTDDSTDDESKASSNKRRPVPAWSEKEARYSAIRSQSYVNTNVIDQFFSVSPMTPDLREIFPAIDARKLKRNSSAVWRTPPRYSQMPKY